MLIGGCSNCKYLDLIESDVDTICPRCSGRMISFGINSSEWNDLSDADKKAIVDDTIPANDSCRETINNEAKSYNYLEKGEFTEKFDSQYFKSIMDQKERDIDLTIRYADEIIQKKNELIRELMDDLDVMNEFSIEDIDELNQLKPSVTDSYISLLRVKRMVLLSGRNGNGWAR